MTRRDRAVRHALSKLAIAERYIGEARAALLELQQEPKGRCSACGCALYLRDGKPQCSNHCGWGHRPKEAALEPKKKDQTRVGVQPDSQVPVPQRATR